MSDKLTPEEIRRLMKSGTPEELNAAQHTLSRQVVTWAAWFVGIKLALYFSIAVASKWARENTK